MKKYLTIKDHAKEAHLFTKRAAIAMLLVTLAMLILIARLYNLQVAKHDTYVTLSDNNRINVLPIAPVRGLIFDRNGVLLADNRPSFSLEITPEQVGDIKTTVDQLEHFITITDDDKEYFYKQLKRKRRFEAVAIRLDLTEEEVASFAVNRHLVPGVEIAAGLTRNYPLGAASAHLLGYVSRINEQELKNLDTTNYSATQTIGKTGIEKTYEDQLHGKVGYAHVETNVHGRIVRTLERQDPIPGKTLHLTIDAKLQQAATEAMAGKRGAIVAVDPQDGAVLAMVSHPNFNPNLFASGLDNKTFRKLQSSQDRPLFNRALRGQYPPGSTIKPILGLEALATGVINSKEQIFDPGWFQLPNDDHRYRDWKRKGHGWMNLQQAISQSCSTFFYNLADKMGIDKMSSILQQFGFGEKTNIDLVGELPGLLPSREWKRQRFNQPWYPGETLITGIGQGYTLVTPIQLANAVTILANKGKKMPLHIVGGVVDSSGETSADTQSEVQTATPRIDLDATQSWKVIERAMLAVTNNPYGTAYGNFHSARYRIAAKTGTAQVAGIKQGEKYDEATTAKRLRDHSLFIGYAPLTNPRIAIAMIIENEKGSAKIARQVLDNYLLREAT